MLCDQASLKIFCFTNLQPRATLHPEHVGYNCEFVNGQVQDQLHGGRPRARPSRVWRVSPYRVSSIMTGRQINRAAADMTARMIQVPRLRARFAK